MSLNWWPDARTFVFSTTGAHLRTDSYTLVRIQDARVTRVHSLAYVGASLVELGAACSKYQDEKIRGIRSKRIQADEIWSFVGAKAKNTSEEKKAQGWDDCWTWTASDAESKLMLSWRLVLATRQQATIS
jgi:hypothetical protein